jgi:hypothetical protein
MIHHFSTGPTMDQFAVINREMLKNSKYTLLSDSKILNDTWTVEYSGQRDVQAFHCYRKVVRKGRIFYEITATATEEQWKSVADKLKACVDSFETIKGEAGASASTTNPASQPVR